MSLPSSPNTRKEMYLSNMAGQGTALPSEPHTREEEYLDFIAKNGGGGGTGDGDMKKSVYDGDLAVLSAGGIKGFVNGAIAGKVDKVDGKGLSTNDYDNSAKSAVDGLSTALNGKVDKIDGKGLSTNDYDDSAKAIVDGITAELGNKADKVSSATNGDLASLDSNGNLTDSGKKVSDFYNSSETLETDLDGADKFPFYDFSASAKRHITFGSIKAKLKEYFDLFYTNLVSSATNGNFASLDANGNLVDSGKKASDFATTGNVIANTKLIKDTVGWSGKNKLDPNYVASNPSTPANVTVSYDSKGVLNFNGASSAENGVNLKPRLPDADEKKNLYLPKGKYRYSIFASDTSSLRINVRTTYNNAVRDLGSSGWDKDYVDFEITDDFQSDYKLSDGSALISLNVEFKGNITFNNLKVYVMCADANLIDQSWEAPSVSTAFPRSEQAVLGAKNLLENTANTQTLNGVTFTVNADKSVTVNGTATASSFLNIPVKLPKGRYIFSGTNGQTGGSDSKYYMRIRNADGTRPTTITPSTVESINGSETEFEVSNDGLDARVNLCVYPEAGTLNNIIFYPMIRLASDTDSTYAPYAMTNKEITDTYYKAGDTITLNDASFNGFITAGGTELHLQVPFRTIGKISGISIGSTTNLYARGNKGYLQDSAGNTMSNYLFTTNLKVYSNSTGKIDDNIITLVLKNTDDGAFANVDNNTPISIQFNIFSMTLL